MQMNKINLIEINLIDLSVNILGDNCFEEGLAYMGNNIDSRQNFQTGKTPH